MFENMILGFHRLAINGLTDAGQQPFFIDGDFLLCNGEIYNHAYLEQKYDIENKSGSDCECLLPLFRKIGIEKALSEIDGVFAIICRVKGVIYAIRDRVGVRPLFMYTDDVSVALASDPKSLEFDTDGKISEILPSTYQNLTTSESLAYYSIPTAFYGDSHDDMEVVRTVREKLEAAINSRLMSDREVGCLLSGGLDSSIIAAVLAREFNAKGKKLHTFSIGFPDSVDIKYARIVADHIGSEHHEYIIDYNAAIANIPNVVKALSTYDITTVRASTPMWMLCKWISENFSEKVLFSGEGSDEVFSGYLYFHLAPEDRALTDESERLVANLYKYDVLRADRCISSNGLELREPFLDKGLIDYYMSLPGNVRRPRDGYEKWVLRKAFEDLLPEEVAWRRKAAFSDAVSCSEKPWYKYIQEWADKNHDKLDGFVTNESSYYYSIFKSLHTLYSPTVEYWLPKWQNVGTEPSATVLTIFKKNEHK
jgi:asparagine synthase (glutamine-hydrolysing)